MACFVVTTEEFYGGGSDKVKIFRNRDLAEQYTQTFEDLDTLILERNCTEDTVFLVVTEEWYGGEMQVQIFDNKTGADLYANSISDNDKLDVLVWRKLVI